MIPVGFTLWRVVRLSAQVRRGATFSPVNSIGPSFLEKLAKYLQVARHDVRVVASATADSRSLALSTIPKVSREFKPCSQPGYVAAAVRTGLSCF